MSLRIRFGTSSFLLMMTLIAVCFGWLADRSWLAHKLHVITMIEEQQWKTLSEVQKQSDYCIKVNRGLIENLKAANDKLRANGLPTRP